MTFEPSEKTGSIKLVDSHAHLDMPDFDPDRTEVIARAEEQGICGLLCPSEISDPKSLRNNLDLAARYPWIFAAAGVHPHNAQIFSQESVSELQRLAAGGEIRAVGEIGLDFHYNLSPPKDQLRAFREQLRLAQELDLPVIIHSRAAAKDIAAAIDLEGFTRGGVLHCFTEDREFAEKMLERGFWISFSGILTFPKALEIKDTARALPSDRILIETDSPFLTPVPFRGKIKRNEPRLVYFTAKYLAELRKVSLTDLAEQTTRNFMACFRFDIPGY